MADFDPNILSARTSTTVARMLSPTMHALVSISAAREDSFGTKFASVQSSPSAAAIDASAALTSLIGT